MAAFGLKSKVVFLCFGMGTSFKQSSWAQASDFTYSLG